ncbi:hypothetical protein [Paraburkholderia sp. J12]|uniref:hypothetical protein n=1 Tax=Paraburkholderia sp. J12 TaxID=2805432 RepID=UPI002ABD1930|nr:hypothetical protein [Paraburkholderia sp. J12]
MQRLRLIALVLPLTLAGCLSFSSSDPSPPQRETVVVPQSSITVPPGTTCTTPC